MIRWAINDFRNNLRQHPHVGLSLLCIGLVVVSMLLIWPVVETGVMDDWSYVFTAGELARTGHVHYNGWSTASLGWPLYVGAAAVRVFGLSFTVVRLTTMIEALLCVVLFHRTLLRTGLSAWNATAGTLVLAFSPVFMLMATSFMSDLAGMLAVVVCLYACLRALETPVPRASQGWIAVAAFSNAVLGSARQIAWLGVLVMVPSTLWLLRKRRRLGGDLAISAAAVCLAFLTWHWYNTQPYSVPEKLFAEPFTLGGLGHLAQVSVAFALDLGLLVTPLALGMWSVLRHAKSWRRGVLIAVASSAGLFALRAVLQHHGTRYMVPALRYSKVTNSSIESLFAAVTAPPKGPAPRPLLPVVQGAGSLVSVAALLCFLGAALLHTSGRRTVAKASQESQPTWHDLLWLTVPYLAAYCFLLTPRAMSSWLFDRYLLLILPCVVLLVMRLYQAQIASVPTPLTAVLLATLAVFTTVSTHDFYAVYRASLVATRRVQAAGVPRTAIDGGWEYNHYTELLVNGFVWQPGMRLTDGSVYTINEPYPAIPPCSLEAQPQTPHVEPKYSLAYPGSRCTPVPQFVPVHFHAWLPPTQRTILVVYADR